MYIIEPLLKLNLLKSYMDSFIEKYPYPVSFGKWLKLRKPQYIVGRPEYYRAAATHCFYCERKFGKNAESTIDHFYPQSLSGGSHYSLIRVICCQPCNINKSNEHPDVWIRKFTIADMKGLSIKNYNSDKIKKISKNANTIFNDVLFNSNKRIYYLAKYEKAPIGMIKIKTPRRNGESENLEVILKNHQ